MKTVRLTKGHVAVVDDDDYERVSQFKWQYGGTGYARRTKVVDGVSNTIYMHKFVIGVVDGEVDHIDHDSLNNQRANLRICTRSQNMRNVRRSKLNTSGFKGVHYNKRAKGFLALIKINGRRLNLGTFDRAQDAARVYDAVSRFVFGTYAWTNFSEEPAPSCEDDDNAELYLARKVVEAARTLHDAFYPADVFDGSSGDPGVTMILAMRKALAAYDSAKGGE